MYRTNGGMGRWKTDERKGLARVFFGRGGI